MGIEFVVALQGYEDEDKTGKNKQTLLSAESRRNVLTKWI